ncbi:hypothetical protein ACQ1ZZ_15100, partial [Enterococcus faecalis]
GRRATVTIDTEIIEGSITRQPERDELNPENDEALDDEYYNQKHKDFKRSNNGSNQVSKPCLTWQGLFLWPLYKIDYFR